MSSFVTPISIGSRLNFSYSPTELQWTCLKNRHNGGHMGSREWGRPTDSCPKGLGFESRQERRENFLLQGQLSVLTLISVPVPPRVTAVARKKSRSFSQKCRLQVTAINAYNLSMWLRIKWHCKLVHDWMVYTELAPRRQQFHVAPAKN